jgi:hypothetical protein
MIRDPKVPRQIQDHDEEMINEVTAYCNNISDCRQTLVLKYFQQNFTREECAETCDNCQSKNYLKFKPKDVTDHAKRIVAMMKEAQANPDIGDVTAKQFADTYRGSKSKQVSTLSPCTDSAQPDTFVRSSTKDSTFSKVPVEAQLFPYSTLSASSTFFQVRVSLRIRLYRKANIPSHISP